MKRLRRVLSLAISLVALTLLIATCVLWIRSRRNIDYVDFTRFNRTIRMESDSRNGLYLSVTNLTPTVAANVSGITATSKGWTLSGGKPITIRTAALSVGPIGTATRPAITSIQIRSSSLSIAQTRFQFRGFVWSSGFMATNAVAPGPFPARQLDLFTLTYPTALVVLAIIMLITIYFALPKRPRFAAGFCQSCGYDLRATPNQCPECGSSVGAPT